MKITVDLGLDFKLKFLGVSDINFFRRKVKISYFNGYGKNFLLGDGF